MRPRIYSAYDVPPQVQLECKDVSKTRQSELASCDINNIVKQFDKTGMLPQVVGGPVFLDVSYVGDYRTAIDQVRMAEGFFSALPAKVRAEFANDPASFLDFASNGENRKQMQEWGLIAADPVVEDVKP